MRSSIHSGVLDFQEGQPPQRFFEAMSELLAVVDRDGRFRAANGAWHTLLGWPADELVDQPVRGFLHPEDRASGLEAGSVGQQTVADVRFRDRQGRYRWLEWTGTTGQDGLLYAIVRDHTERRHLDALTQAIVDDVTDYAIFMLDRDGHVRTWNRGAARAKGYRKEEILGRHFSVFYPAGQQNRPLRLLKQAEAEGRAEDEGWRVRKDGSRFWANVVITAVHDDRGRVIGFTKLTRDLTERRRREQAEQRALRQALELEQLERLSALRADLLNLVAHELRTPLTPLRMQVQLLQSQRLGPLATSQVASLAILERNLLRLTKLIEDILYVSRIEAGKVSLDVTEVDVAALLEEARAVYAVAAQEKGVTLGVAAPPGLRWPADAARITQVVYGLVDNAVQCTPAGGRITLRASVDDHLLVEVEDSGKGLSEEQRARLFEPFVQVHEDDQSGSGLGLYIARGIVARHGGTIDCRSSGPGHGATFWFRLPGRRTFEPAVPAGT